MVSEPVKPYFYKVFRALTFLFESFQNRHLDRKWCSGIDLTHWNRVEIRGGGKHRDLIK